LWPLFDFWPEKVANGQFFGDFGVIFGDGLVVIFVNFWPNWPLLGVIGHFVVTFSDKSGQ
jgi:hypothetical protein